METTQNAYNQSRTIYLQATRNNENRRTEKMYLYFLVNDETKETPTACRSTTWRRIETICNINNRRFQEKNIDTSEKGNEK